MMSLPAMSLGLRFHVSRKSGTGGGGWVYPKGANSIATSGLISRNDLVGTGWAISLLLCMVELRKQTSCLVGLPFLKVFFHGLYRPSLAKSHNN